MTDETRKLHRNIKSAALDLADAVLDLTHHQACGAPEDQERIDIARVYMHEVAGGDDPPDVPKREILFTVGAVIAGLPSDQAVANELRASLMPALAALLEPGKPTRPRAKELPRPCASSRPPGVPNSKPSPGPTRKTRRKRRAPRRQR